MTQNQYQKMAGAFLDLWQEQLTRSMTDKDFIHATLDAMRRMQGQGASAFRDTYEQQENRNAAPASGAGADELDDLRQRLAACERRIARLESRRGAEKSTDKPKKSQSIPKKPKAKPKKAGNGGSGRTRQPAKPAAPARAPGKSKAKAVKRAVKRK